MKRIRSSDEEKAQLSQVSNEGSFKKRNVEMGETHASMLNWAFFDVIPNICARSIETEKNYRTVSRLAQVCKDMQQKVQEFLFYISTYICEETWLVKSDAICLLKALAMHQAIRDISTINNLVKNTLVIFFDPQVRPGIRRYALITTIHTINLTDSIHLDPNFLAILLNRLMNMLKANPKTHSIIHGYIITLLNKLHDKGLIKLADFDTGVLEAYPFIEIMRDKTVRSLCKEHIVLMYCKLIQEKLIGISEDDCEDIEDNVISDYLESYPKTSISIDLSLLLTKYMGMVWDTRPNSLTDTQLEFLKKCAIIEKSNNASLMQSLETSQDVINTLCDLNRQADYLEYAHRVMLEYYLNNKIFPIAEEMLQSASDCVRGQFFSLMALMPSCNGEFVDMVRDLEEKEKAEIVVNQIITTGLKMFDDSKSSPSLKESILYVIFCFALAHFKDKKALLYSLSDEQATSLHDLASSVLSADKDSYLEETIEIAQSLINLFSRLDMQV